jgi:ABC-type nitrate/sulfonate/bicarbonate transport system substrate-binding protein
MRMKQLSTVILAIVAAVILAGSPAAQQPAVLSAAVGSNMNHVPSFVGVEKGIFLKHGIDLKLKVLNTGQEMAKALQAGARPAGGAELEAGCIGAGIRGDQGARPRARSRGGGQRGAKLT